MVLTVGGRMVRRMIFSRTSARRLSSWETSSAGVSSSSTSVSKVVVADVSASSSSPSPSTVHSSSSVVHSSYGAVVSTPVPSNSSFASTLAASHSPSCTPVILMSTVTETKVVTSVQYVTLHKKACTCIVVLFLTFIKSVLSTYRSGFSYERKILVYQKGFGFCVRSVYIKSEDIYSVNMSEFKVMLSTEGMQKILMSI